MGTWGALGTAEEQRYHRTVTDAYRVVDNSERCPPEAAASRGVEVKTDAELAADAVTLLADGGPTGSELERDDHRVWHLGALWRLCAFELFPHPGS